MKIVFATTNKRKIEDVLEIIKENNLDVSLLTLDDILFQEEIEEDGTTLQENSFIKAKTVSDYCKKQGIPYPVIADDTGLFIDALHGEPGIYTARYAGENATQKEQIDKLLNNMKQYTKMEDRTCKFVCVLTAILPNGKKIVARGECKGMIALNHGKLGGLTYGPIFIPNGFDKPMGDMEEAEYASVHNHRDIAMEELVKKFKELGY